MISVYLEPKTLFPTELPSNTIFGAICSSLSDLGKDVGGMVDNFKISPPFLVSSAFPYVSSEKTHHFLPPPEHEPAKVESKKDYDSAKEYKKAKFIHEDIFNQWIRGGNG